MRIVCWQTILLKYHTLFFSKIGKDEAKFVVCCSRDWRFKGSAPITQSIWGADAYSFRVPQITESKNSLTFPWLFTDHIQISLTQNIDICQAYVGKIWASRISEKKKILPNVLV